MNGVGITMGSGDLAELVAIHLQDEEAVLFAALPMVRALKAALTGATPEPLPEMAQRHSVLANLLEDMKLRRQRFREQMSRRLLCDADTITLSRIVNDLPALQREPLGASAERVRQMAHEFVAISRWLAIHLRIHLDAYQALLRDLTGTTHGSGRYGPAGTADMGDLRPMIQIKG